MPGWAFSPAAAFIIAVCLAGAAQAEVTVAPAGRGYDIDVAGQVSSAELLSAIATATGVTITGDPEDATIRDSHFRGTSLERALRALLPHAAFVVSFAKNGAPDRIIFLSAAKGEDAGGNGGQVTGTDPNMEGGTNPDDAASTFSPDAQQDGQPGNPAPGN